MPYIVHTNSTIYAVGTTPGAAEAQYRSTRVPMLSDGKYWHDGIVVYTTRCTEALAKLATASGGNCAWRIVDGVADVA